MNIAKIKKVFIIGIEGAGTSALARMLKNQGVDVSGFDNGDHFYFDILENHDIKVIHKYDEINITSDTDLIIYSLAFKPGFNSEVDRILSTKIPAISYGEAVSLLFNEKFGIAISGSHGKTTVTAWLSFILKESGISPSMIVGAKVPQLDGNSLAGNSNYFVLEADEYGNKLQYLQPKAALLNNIDYDHPDFFKTKEDYNQVFIDFIKKISSNGFLIANFDDAVIRKVANVNCRGKIITYAIDETADYVAYDIKQSEGRQYFKVKIKIDDEEDDDEDDIEFKDADLGDFSISLSGKHNISNALAVIATCIELGIELRDIRKYISEFIGTSRRMQIMGEFRGATIVDDYAHHPTEIKTTLAGAREVYKNRKIITVFHPHTFTRTKALLDDFADSFEMSDKVIVLDIYGSARERQGGVHSKDLVALIKNKKAKYIATLDECEKYLRENIERNDVIILMGAGDVFRIGENLVK